MNTKIAFIGAGKIATAISLGLLNSGSFFPEQFYATARTQQTVQNYQKLTGIQNVQYLENKIAIENSQAIIICTKPFQISDLSKEIAPFCSQKLIISLAAGYKLETLFKNFSHKKIIRVLPNTPVTVMLGASAYSMGPGCNQEDEEICKNIFNTIGKLYKVEEHLMDAVCGISGSGPAYVYEFIQGIVDAGIKQGLEKEIALGLAVQTVLGAATMLDRKFGSPEDLKNAVTTPNGTTYAALQVMKEQKFKDIIDDFVNACVKRSVELGKN
ncbi:pyrroline-5-carboxylate reductase, putative [Ichthyophthirius multifiliis]|uniref:Pyrroline-5-carboxylate reductase n=1 Tax=Ichthyophthirius multifiliis TaxID=5932 RepID=G0QJY1_ICHMU|nr:pyrroline-5-carboxylate reductase, putative [Ichthyophthirius multifiliis]EGR34472.1 pyrroline-5-carboxylate reductase, putative [Ichthyophthirius multifiliis]|eukprot:XP_004039776.1 pyrroline-5-carboxylate reductase, putative [Ichthyophthirius multifiliis]